MATDLGVDMTQHHTPIQPEPSLYNEAAEDSPKLIHATVPPSEHAEGVAQSPQATNNEIGPQSNVVEAIAPQTNELAYSTIGTSGEALKEIESQSKNTITHSSSECMSQQGIIDVKVPVTSLKPWLYSYNSEGERVSCKEMFAQPALDILPPDEMPVWKQALEYCQRWGVWAAMVEDDKKRLELMQWVTSKMQDVWKFAIENGHCGPPTGHTQCSLASPPDVEEPRPRERKKRPVDPLRQPADFAGDYGREMFSILNGELEKNGVDMEMIVERLNPEYIQQGVKIMDKICSVMDSPVVKPKDWTRAKGFQALVHPRNLLMFCLWEVQRCRTIIKFHDKPPVSKRAQEKIDKHQLRADQHLVLIALLQEKQGHISDPGSEEEDECEPVEMTDSVKRGSKAVVATDTERPAKRARRSCREADDAKPQTPTPVEYHEPPSSSSDEELETELKPEPELALESESELGFDTKTIQPSSPVVLQDIAVVPPPLITTQQLEDYTTQIWQPRINVLLAQYGYGPLQWRLVSSDQIGNILEQLQYNIDARAQIQLQYQMEFNDWLRLSQVQQTQVPHAHTQLQLRLNPPPIPTQAPAPIPTTNLPQPASKGLSIRYSPTLTATERSNLEDSIGNYISFIMKNFSSGRYGYYVVFTSASSSSSNPRELATGMWDLQKGLKATDASWFYAGSQKPSGFRSAEQSLDHEWGFSVAPPKARKGRKVLKRKAAGFESEDEDWIPA